MRLEAGLQSKEPIGKFIRSSFYMFSQVVLILAFSVATSLAQSNFSDAQSAYDSRDFATALTVANSLAAPARAGR